MSVLVRFAILLSAAIALSAKPPQFIDYPVLKVYRSEAALPKFGNPSQYDGTDLRCFGADRQSYAGKRANFAGHFVIDACTCGTGCHYLFMWDALNGNFFGRIPISVINVGPYGLGSEDGPIEYRGEQYRVDSALLIVEGCVEDTCDCSKRYYQWNGRRFRLLLKVPSKIPPECRK
jgi:hypothetical protein